MLKKGLTVAVVFFFVGMGVTPLIGIAEVNKSSMMTFFDGSLSGYVNDTLMNPIAGARVRVYFHEAYEEDYTDSYGYYHVTNIPICFCLKNAVTSKVGYETERVLLSINENTTYDFVLTALQYNGSLSGYVNNSFMNPIGGARVRVYFHETYEEDYTDSYGYYYVTNIPICYCLKNATCSKEGYKTEWVLLSIVEDTTYDFILTSINNPPGAPTITAPEEVKRGRFFNAKVVTTDPDDDDVYYKFEVDGHNAGWNGPFASGKVYKHWINFGVPPGTYILGVQAKDIHDAEGEWSYVEIYVKSKNRAINIPFLNFLQNHPHLFPILHRLLLQRLGLL